MQPGMCSTCYLLLVHLMFPNVLSCRNREQNILGQDAHKHTAINNAAGPETHTLV